MKVIVIGGGPAGIMSAISAAKDGDDVTILEKMNSLGKKLLITGKGRCNITNNAPMSEFMQNVPTNGKFLYSAFNNFTNRDIINFLNDFGVETKVERGERVFPISDMSKTVLGAFMKATEQFGVKVKTNSKADKIGAQNGQVTGVYISDKFIQADKVILATGGKSYPVTGSTGDGYKMAIQLGHNVVEAKASLVPLVSNDDVCGKLQGLSLRNVEIRVLDKQKLIYKDFGEMLFTHFGVSGPIILSSSAHLIRYKNIESLLEGDSIKLQIDLKPALDVEKLDARVIRDFEKFRNKEFKNSLGEILPQKLIPVIIQKSGIAENKKVSEISKQERRRVVSLLKCLEISINGFRPIDEAIITSGGIDIKEINPKTMESKLIKGLYFAGEIIDVDALTGGFNLQIAYSTGVTAGRRE